MGEQHATLAGEAADHDVVGHQVRNRILHPMCGGQKVGFAPSPGREEQIEGRPVVVDPGEVGVEAMLELLAGGGLVHRRLGDHAGQVRADLGEQLQEQLAFGGEVLVEHRLGDARRLGEVVHRGRMKPPLAEDIEGHAQQLAAAGCGGKAHGLRIAVVTAR